MAKEAAEKVPADYQKAKSDEDACVRYNQTHNNLDYLEKINRRRLRKVSRRTKRTLYRLKRKYYRRNKRLRKRNWRACAKQWKKQVSKVNRFTCWRKFRPRSRRKRGTLWVGGSYEVSINGVSCGTSPFKGRLRPGSYNVELRKGDAVVQTYKINLPRRRLVVLLPKSENTAIAAAPTPRASNTKKTDGGGGLNLNLGNDSTSTQGNGSTPPPNSRQNQAMNNGGQVDDPETPGGLNKTIQRKGETPLFLAVGTRMYTRSLTFQDDLYGKLNAYNLNFAPTISIDLEWYPAAHFTKGPATYVGLFGGVHYTVGVRSVQATAQGESVYEASALSWNVGITGKIPVGPVFLQPRVAFGGQSFDTGASNNPNLLIPAVDYQTVRLGAAVKWNINSTFAVRGSANYRIPLSTGELGSDTYFPKISGGGLDVGAHLFIRIMPLLGVQVGAEYVRYFFAMNVEQNDPLIVGGAVDQYINFDLRVSLHF
tara:strand:+ start:478 stop:1923 length:1446 start_codon:yes stop_codon:yes gene_type:complete